MARTLIYQRDVDIINILDITNVESECDPDNRVKMKEEIIEVASNTNVTAGCIPVKNHSNSNAYDETLLLESNTPLKYTNDKTIECMFNGSFDSVDKVVNLKRNNTESVDEQVCNSLLTSKKGKHCSTEIYNNQCNNDESGAKINSSDKKWQNIESVSKTQGQDILSSKDIKFSEKKSSRKKSSRKKSSVYCNICFRTFSNHVSYSFHQKSYDKYVESGICPFCKRHYLHDNLQQHKSSCAAKYGRKRKHSNYLCNFCKRQFTEKLRLQSHLFHLHSELIYINNTVKSQNFKSASINTVSKTDESLNCNDTHKFIERNIHIDNIDKTKKNTIKPDESMIVKLSSNEMLSTKKSRQRTLREYFEPNENEHDIKTMSNKTNTNSSIIFTSHHDEKTKESLKLKQIKQKELMSDRQDKSLTATSANFQKRGTCSTLKLSEKNEIHFFTKPFVKLHVDVDTIANFLENSPGISKKSLEENENKNETELKKNITISDNIDYNFWKAAMIRFNCKDCTISLKRCDEKLKDHKSLTPKTTFGQNILCNSTSLQTNKTHSNGLFKKLEVRLERLKSRDAIKTKTTLTCNDDLFRCKACGETFSSRLGKHIHIRSCHIGYMSSICNARYRVKYNLLHHYVREHCDGNQCGVCNKLLPSSSALHRHLNVHCLRYVQKKDDQYPINVEIKCRSAKKLCGYPYDNTVHLQSNLITNNQSCDLLLRETKKTPKILSIETFPKIRKTHFDKKTDIAAVTLDEKDQSNKICGNSSNKSTEELQKSQLSLTIETGLNVTKNDTDYSIKNEILSQSKSSEQKKNNLTVTHTTSSIMQPNIIETEENIYSCNVCRKQFHDRKDLEQHIRMLNKSTFVLDHLLSSQTIADSNTQLSKIHNLHCMFCNKSFVQKHELRTHILHFHNQELNKLRTSLYAAEMNKEYLVNGSNGTTVCDICNVKFETHKRYMEHKLYYNGNYTFLCSLCDQRFQGMHMYHYHNKMVHFTNKSRSYHHICDLCNEGFTRKLHFYSHKMHVHLKRKDSLNNTKIFEEKDQYDGVSIIEKEKGILNRSTDPQQKAKQISYRYNNCHICKLKHADVDNMISKKLLLYIKYSDFLCIECSMKYATFKQFDQHIKSTHSYSYINSEYPCSIITKVSGTNTSLFSKPKYNCLFCNIKFSSISYARTHIMRFHIGKSASSKTASKSKTTANTNDDIQKVTTEKELSFKNTQSHKQCNNISPIEIANEHETRSVNSLNSGSITDSQAKLQICLLTSSTYKPNVNSMNYSLTKSTKKFDLLAVLSPCNFNESNDKEIIQVNNYTCPICKLRYSSLISIQSHLRFTHMDFIRASMVNPELNQFAQRSRIECLLCECVFTEEIDYKRHLEDFHMDHISNSEEIRDIDNAKVNSDNLIYDDDLLNEVLNVCHDHNYTKPLKRSTELPVVQTSSKISAHASNTENRNIGKLRVKPFAKIIECLSADALKL